MNMPCHISREPFQETTCHLVLATSSNSGSMAHGDTAGWGMTCISPNLVLTTFLIETLLYICKTRQHRIRILLTYCIIIWYPIYYYLYYVMFGKTTAYIYKHILIPEKSTKPCEALRPWRQWGFTLFSIGSTWRGKWRSYSWRTARALSCNWLHSKNEGKPLKTKWHPKATYRKYVLQCCVYIIVFYVYIQRSVSIAILHKG